MSYTILQHLKYNNWATDKVIEFLKNADESIFDLEQKSSFTTIRKTILHIWDAEVIWHERLKGNSFTDWPSKSFTGTNIELLEGWQQHNRALTTYVETNSAGLLASTITYKNMKGDSFENTAESILFHVVNHGTFHRGQLITMMRFAGMDGFSSQDLISFLRL